MDRAQQRRAMNGLEFARCTTAGGFRRVLVHAAPGQASIEIIDSGDRLVVRATLTRSGDYTPMTLIELDGTALRRCEVWPARAGLHHRHRDHPAPAAGRCPALPR